MQVSSTMSSPPTSSSDRGSTPEEPAAGAVEKGVAGRINYAAWDKVATDLVQQVDQEEQAEIAEEKAKVCYYCM